MKKVSIIITFILSGIFVNAQDIIYKSDGTEIKAKILELTTETIKYKKFEQLEGPTRNILLLNVFMIIYEDGTREIIKDTQQPTNNAIEQEEIIKTSESPNSIAVAQEKVPEDDYDGNYYMLGVGYGNSYGGAGVRYQWRIGGVQGFGLHTGIGYFPNAEILWSVGAKFFFYKDFYINTQYGSTGWEEYSTYSNSNSTYDGHVLEGASFLIGGDWVWGIKDKYGFNFGIGITYNSNVLYLQEMEETLAIDLGFLIKF